MPIINLTQHAIHLPDRTIEPSGQIARCVEVTTPAGSFDGVELVNRAYGHVYEIPTETPGVLFVVSFMVRKALERRKDLASPGDLVRDDSGRIIGCTNLVVNE